MPNLRTSVTLLLLLAAQISFWTPGLSYEQFLTLSGYLAINFMSITMVLATRPAWLESPLGGLDSMYKLHKWTGILAVVFAVTHWLTEMADDGLEALFGSDRSLKEADFSGLLDSLQDGAEDLGEPGLYLLLFLVVITLTRWVPYYYWRYLHRVMPVIYLVLAAHALLLAPLKWWQQPTGWLMTLLIAGGAVAGLQSLTGQIGRSRRYKGLVQAVKQTSANITEVVCDMGKRWPGHQAGQFALVTFDRIEGAHPFSLSSADDDSGQLSFHIKALGDYTRKIPRKLRSGQTVTLEGPYGRFDPDSGRKNAQQIWVAGGIGITPFLAALEKRLINSEQKHPAITLHYCTTGATVDPMVTRLQELTEQLPDILLHIYDSQVEQRLTVDQLQIHDRRVDVWFCGPQGLAKALRSGLKQQPISLRFHQESFEFR
ncbi:MULTISPECIES: ferredoxin reductase family protein [Marinobacter]|uniref:Ferric reductase-like transmembrane domain-containing protein n=1 Tax=Marinobacter xiaoshiensis TaxID=3073652 RepID=A0ABU2HGZ1_9GAMM|nr:MULTISPECIES: ferric reductase-like transmembrane domain-containing protein [unclassified Marinobacter]MBK1887871.1 ferric reductase-like transmembrane domain-containing protein [Marinobacter sp. DY40_1A1]MDS1310302.1 ferric reductase-like transmembrane domain-containing protein [Marinobacter sp. F60267]